MVGYSDIPPLIPPPSHLPSLSLHSIPRNLQSLPHIVYYKPYPAAITTTNTQISTSHHHSPLINIALTTPLTLTSLTQPLTTLITTTHYLHVPSVLTYTHRITGIRKAPQMTSENWKELSPVGLWAALAHAFSVLALGAGTSSSSSISSRTFENNSDLLRIIDNYLDLLRGI